MRASPFSLFAKLLVGAFVLCGLVLIFVLTHAKDGTADLPTPTQTINTAWQRAQAAERYAYASSLAQTTYPAATLANVGATARQDQLHIIGDVNRRDAALHMALSSGDASIPVNKMEVKIEDGQAWKKQGEAWQPLKNVEGAFTNGDPLVWLTNIRQAQAGETRIVLGKTFHSVKFAVDGPAFAEQMRAKLENYLRENGQLPGGITLSMAQMYKDMQTTGEVWIGDDDLPARMTLHMNFPAAENGERMTAVMDTAFNEFKTAPPAWNERLQQAATGWGQAVGWPQTAAGRRGLGLLFGAMVLATSILTALYLLLGQRRFSRGLMAALVILIALQPMGLHLRPAQAFVLKQSAEQAEERTHQQKQEAEQVKDIAQEEWKPELSPLVQNAAYVETNSVPETHLSVTTIGGPRSASNTTSNKDNKDTDNDGLSDSDEKLKYITKPDVADTDGDGLSDGEEVLRAATNPLNADSDKDGLNDYVEVTGWFANGRAWYSDPLFRDSDRDGLLDGNECAAQQAASKASASTQAKMPACEDTDSDGKPDVFDRDSDNDGLSDKTDKNTGGVQGPFKGDSPFELAIDGLTQDKPTFVELQLRPVATNHLFLNMNVLDWPSDNAGQVRNEKDNKFGTSGREANGNLRLVPMLEIKMPDSAANPAPLPRISPAATLNVAADWLNGTVQVQAQGSNTEFVFKLSKTANIEAKLYKAGCDDAYLPNSALISPTLKLDVGTTQSRSGGVLTWMNGTYSLRFVDTANAANRACVDLQDLPNGAQTNTMVNTALYENYGLSVRDVGENELATYLPLYPVRNNTNGFIEGYTGRMMYRQSGSSWGSPHKMRLVWVMQYLADDGSLQILHSYTDDWLLQSLSVREELGTQIAVAFEKPAQDNDLKLDDPLWKVAGGLERDFISGRALPSSANKLREVTLDTLAQRFNSPTTTALTPTWGVTPSLIGIELSKFETSDALGLYPTGKSSDLLRRNFASYTQATPTLLFVREESYRTSTPNATLKNNQWKVDMSVASVPPMTMAAFSWMPFQFNTTKNNWEPLPLEKYWDSLGVNLDKLFRAERPAALPANNEAATKLAIDLARGQYIVYAGGMNGLVEINKSAIEIVSEQEPANTSDPFLKRTEDILTSGPGEVVKRSVNGLISNAGSEVANAGKWDNVVAKFKNSFKVDYVEKTTVEATRQVTNQAGNLVDQDYVVDNFNAKSTSGSNGRAGLVAVAGVIAIGAGIARLAGANNSWVNGAMAGSSVVLAANTLYESSVTLRKTLATVGNLKGSLAEIRKTATKGALIGAAVESATAVVTFVLELSLADGGIGGSAALSNFIAALIVIAIVLLLDLLTGGLFSAALGLIDAILLAICKVGGLADDSFVCQGLQGSVGAWLGKVILNYKYARLVGNLSEADHFQIANFKPRLSSPERGFVVGNMLEYRLVISSSVVLAADSEGIDDSSRCRPSNGAPPHCYFENAKLAKTTLAFSLSANKKREEAALDKMKDSWSSLPFSLEAPAERTAYRDANKNRLYAPLQPIAAEFKLDQIGLNLSPQTLYINEAQAAPEVECSTFSGCDIKTDKNFLHIPFTQTWDVFPATLDEFYKPRKIGDYGYTLAWDASFTTQRDFDGDGLISKAFPGGTDPNDSTPDADNDGLTDDFEIGKGWNPQSKGQTMSSGAVNSKAVSSGAVLGPQANGVDVDVDGLPEYEEFLTGTDPNKADSDYDGLTDGEEVTGWEIVYGIAPSGVLSKTWVTSDPLSADADEDGLSDKQERIYGFNPWAFNVPIILTMDAGMRELTAPTTLIRFDEAANADASATTFNDSAGSANSFACTQGNCPSAGMPGKLNNAALFNGSSQSLSSTTALSLTGSSFTLAFWAKRSNAGRSGRAISFASSSGEVWAGFSGDAFSCGFPAGTLNSSSSYPDTNWHHWACAFDVSSGGRTLYRDGVAIGTDTAAAPQINAPMVLGANSTRTADWFDGLLDEVSITPLALQAASLTMQSTGAYNLNDLVVKPGQSLAYQATIKNELLNRYTPAVFTVNAPNTVSGLPAPQNAILNPAQQATLNGTVTIAPTAPSGLIQLTQLASAQVLDTRESAGYPFVWAKFDAPNSLFDSSGTEPPNNMSKRQRLTRGCEYNQGAGRYVCTNTTLTPTLESLDGAPGKNQATKLQYRIGSLPNTRTSGVLEELDQLHFSSLTRLPTENLSLEFQMKEPGAGGMRLFTWKNDDGSRTSLLMGSAGLCRDSSTLQPSRLCAALPFIYRESWWKIVYVKEGSTERFYANGVRLATTTGSAGSIPDAPYFIAGAFREISDGDLPNTSYRESNFVLDELKIYNTALPESQLLQTSGASTQVLRAEFDSNNFPYCVPSKENQCPQFAGNAGITGGAMQLSTNPLRYYTDGHWAQTEGTLSAWFFPTNANSTQTLLQHRPYFNNTVMFNVARVGQKVQIKIGSLSSFNTYITTDVMPANAWTHLAVAWGSNVTKLYINGVLWQSYPAAPAELRPVEFGPLDGRVDEYQLYNKIISDDEVYQLYRASLLKAQFNFDDAPGAAGSVAGLRNAVDASGRNKAVCARANACPTSGVAGRLNNAALFDGIDDALYLPDPNIANQSFSIATWAKRNSNGTNDFVIGQGNGSTNAKLHMGFLSNNRFACGFDDANRTVTSAAYTDGDWNHWVCTYDGSSKTRKIYRNGAEVASSVASASYNSGGNFYIGANHTGLNDTFDGWLDDLRIYYATLGSGDIAALIAATPKLNVKFDEPVSSVGLSAWRYADTASTNSASCTPSSTACPAQGIKGQVGPASRFDGLNDYLDIPAANVPAMGDAISLMGWMKLVNTTKNQKLAGRFDPGSSKSGYLLGVENNQLSAEIGDSGGSHFALAGGKVSPNLWTHVGLTWQRGGKMILYLNGQEVARRDASANPVGNANSYNFRFGAAPWNASEFLMDGLLDDWALYARALPATELRDLYNDQIKYVEDRKTSNVLVDADAPTSSLTSYAAGQVYRPNLYQVLGARADDPTSNVSLLALGVRRAGASTSWVNASRCADASGAWCPTFDPTQLGGEGPYFISTRATDAVGNVEVAPSEASIWVDGAAPTISSNIANGALLAAPNNALALSFSITDPPLSTGEAGSGVKSVYVTLLNANGESTGASRQIATQNGNTWQLSYAFNPQAATGTHTVRVEAEDNVGNKRSLDLISLIVDATAPIAHTTANKLGTLAVPVSATTTLSGSVNASDVASVETALWPSNDEAFYTDSLSAGQVLYLPLDDQPVPGSLPSFSNLASATAPSASCVAHTRCPRTGLGGKQGQAAEFVTANANEQDVLNSNVSPALANSSFSVAFWARRNSVVLPYKIDFGFFASTLYGPNQFALGQGTAANNQGLHVGFRGSNKFTCGFWGSDLDTPDAYTDKDWHHWACSFDATTRKRTIYRDGIAVASDTAASNYVGSGNIFVGANWNGSADYFDGLLDEVRVLTRSLSAGEMTQLQLGYKPLLSLSFDAPDAMTNGATVSDDSAWRNDGVLTTNDAEDKRVSGNVGSSALRLDGVNDVLRLSQNPTLNQTSFSIAAWARRGSTGTSDFVAGQGAAAPNAGLHMGFRPNNKFTCGFYANDLDSPAAYTDNAWHHWACTYDRTNNVRRLYLDGNLIAQDAPSAPYAGSGPFYVGANWAGNGDWFHGALDEVRVYPRALAEQELLNLVGMGWQRAGLSSTAWAANLPQGLEGSYRVHLRTTDALGNANTDGAGLTAATVDTRAPRLSVTRVKQGADATLRTLYTAVIEDANLNMLDSGPGCTVISSRDENISAAWYWAAYSKQLNPFRRTLQCTVPGEELAPRSFTACDVAGNCSSQMAVVSGSVSQWDSESVGQLLAIRGVNARGVAHPQVRQTAASPDAALLAGPDVNIYEPIDGTVFTTTDPIPLFIGGTSPDGMQAFTVTLNNTLIFSYELSAGEGPSYELGLDDEEPLPSDGVYIVGAQFRDALGNISEKTATIYQDTQPPTITISSTTNSLSRDGSGAIELTGWVSDAVGIDAVTLDVGGSGESQFDLPAQVNDHAWSVRWLPSAAANVDGGVFTFIAKAKDRAGFIAQETQTFLVDVIAPALEIANVNANGAPLQNGQVLAAANVAVTYDYTITDGGGFEEVQDYFVSEIGGSGGNAVSFPPQNSYSATGHGSSQANAGNGQDGGTVSLYSDARDVRNNYRSETPLVSFIHDTAQLPDYIRWNEATGQPSLHWLSSGCTNASNDARSGKQQKFYVTQGSLTQGSLTQGKQGLALAWEGADWDVDGDLFIYLDSVPDQNDPNANPRFVRHGGNVAYDPFTATNPSTLMLLPTRDWIYSEGLAQIAEPGLNTLNADFAVWVRGQQTAVLLRWDDATNQWTQAYTLPTVTTAATMNTAQQTGGYFFDPGVNNPRSWVLLPFDVISATLTPQSGKGLQLVAFATEENALRTWASAPADNPLNSSRATPYAPALGQPHKLLMTTRFEQRAPRAAGAVNLDMGNGGCISLLGSLAIALTNDRGVAFSSSDNDARLVLPPSAFVPYAIAKPAWDGLFDDYDDAYQTWLSSTFCAAPENATNLACKATPPSEAELLAQLNRTIDTQHRPLQPGEVVSYVLRVQNPSPASYGGAWVDLDTNGASDMQWQGGCDKFELPVHAFQDSSVVITGVVGTKPITEVRATIYGDYIGIGPCSFTAGAEGVVGTVWLHHTPDLAAPSYVGIVEPTTVISRNAMTVRGSVVDSSDVRDLALEITSPSGSVTALACTDTTPSDGNWSCAWDVAATNGGLAPSEGQTFKLRARAKDVFGQTSAWSTPYALLVDVSAPTMNTREELRDSAQSARGMYAEALLSAEAATQVIPAIVGPSNAFLSGDIADNRLVQGVDVCDATGTTCAQAETTVKVDTVPTSQYVYDDEPASAIALNGATCSERPFLVSDVFAIADLQVGMVISHPYRTEMTAKLTAPNGKVVTLLNASSSLAARNYNVRLSNSQPADGDAAMADHLIDETSYGVVLQPAESLNTLQGDVATGLWKLTLCDVNAAQHSGSYVRSQLAFVAHIPPNNTQAVWKFGLQEIDGLDGVTRNYVLFARDSLGNRGAALPIAIQIDTVPPVLTATQVITQFAFTQTMMVVRGSVSDGVSVAGVYAMVELPSGKRVIASASYADGLWHFDLAPEDAGIYTVWLYARDEVNNVAMQGPYQVEVTAVEATKPRAYFLPIVFRNYVAQADLTLSKISIEPATGNANEPVRVRVVVKNQGNATATGFWVDVYVDPVSAPAQNQSWNDLCNPPWPNASCYGGTWFVNQSLAPGQSLTLTTSALLTDKSYSHWTGKLPAGTHTFYARVDSFAENNAMAGLVNESDESNNMIGPERVRINGMLVAEPMTLEGLQLKRRVNLEAEPNRPTE